MSSSFGCGLGPPLALVVSGSGAGVGATGAGLGAALASSLVEGLQAVRTRAAVNAEPSRRKRIGCMLPVWPDEVARKQGFPRGGNTTLRDLKPGNRRTDEHKEAKFRTLASWF